MKRLVLVLCLISITVFVYSFSVQAEDLFSLHTTALNSPAQGAFVITTSNSVDLTIATRGIFIGGAGKLAVKTVTGDVVTFNSVGAGSTLSIRVNRVYNSSTATNLIGLY